MSKGVAPTAAAVVTSEGVAERRAWASGGFRRHRHERRSQGHPVTDAAAAAAVAAASAASATVRTTSTASTLRPPSLPLASAAAGGFSSRSRKPRQTCHPHRTRWARRPALRRAAAAGDCWWVMRQAVHLERPATAPPPSRSRRPTTRPSPPWRTGRTIRRCRRPAVVRRRLPRSTGGETRKGVP